MRLRPPRSPHLDRRSLLQLGSAAALAWLASPWPRAQAFAHPAPQAEATLVLADRRYDESLNFAASLKQQGAEILPLTTDLADLWFNAIAPRLPGELQAMAGLTLAADLFGLERLAENSGATTRYVGRHDWRCRKDGTHVLSGTIDLDRIAAALKRGKDHWARTLGRSLGAALAPAGDRHMPRQVRSLVLAQDAASGSPRYFVSWLMTWSQVQNASS